MNSPVTSKVQIRNRLGMHARAAAKLVNLAARYQARVEVEKDGQTADAKSIMGVLLLCGHQGATLTIRAEGPDSNDAVLALTELVEGSFGEDQ